MLPKVEEWTDDQLEEWTNARLDEDFSHEAAYEATHKLGSVRYVQALASGRRLVAERAIRAAVAAGDAETLAELAHDLSLRRFAFSLLLAKRGRGRAKGDRRRGDIEPGLRSRLEGAVADEKAIRALWQRELGLSRPTHRDNGITATEIAARRWNIIGNHDDDDYEEDLEQLINFKKSQSRSTD